MNNASPSAFYEIKGVPFLGSLPSFRHDALTFFTRALEEHGDRVRMRVLGRQVFLICHPQDIEQVLICNAQSYGRSAEIRKLRPIFGEGLLASDGSLWRRQRQLIQPSFQRDAMANYCGIMLATIRRQILNWRPGDTIDVHAEMLKYTRDTICRVLFGNDLSPLQIDLANAVTTIFAGLRSEILYLPLWRRLPTKRSRAWNRAVRTLNGAIHRVIVERRQCSVDSDDLLGSLLRARGAEGECMSDRQIHDEVLTFFLAGHETAALSLTWTFYLIATDPGFQERLRDEARTTLSEGGFAPDDHGMLPLAGAAVKESLRLYPPVWSMGREVTATTSLDGQALEKGSDIWICLHRLHRDPRWYPSPDRFDPTRWIRPPPPAFTYLPFGVGARTCIGRHFATAESSLGLAAVISRYRIERTDKEIVHPSAWMTLRPSRPVYLRLSKP